MTTHTLPMTRENLHGHFDNALPPALRIKPGDTVRFSIWDASWRHHPTEGIRALEFKRDPELDKGHAMGGPIFVEGAKPGMTLEIQIGELRPGRTGWTGSRIVPAHGLTRLAALEWQIDGESGTATDQMGHVVKLSPFLGVMGNAPAAPGGREPGLQGATERDDALPAGRSGGRAVQHGRWPRGARRRRGERDGDRVPDGAGGADV